jgi:hypothetical protein
VTRSTPTDRGEHRSYPLVAAACLLSLLCACASVKPVTLTTQETATSFKARSLDDAGLESFGNRQGQREAPFAVALIVFVTRSDLDIRILPRRFELQRRVAGAVIGKTREQIGAIEDRFFAHLLS